jgi:membrane protein
MEREPGQQGIFFGFERRLWRDERRGFIKLTAQSLAFTIGAIVFAMLALLAVIVVPLILAFLGLHDANALFAPARWPAILGVTIFFLACLYRLGPSRAKPRWRWVTWGGAFAALAWVGLSSGFSWYVEHFGSYNKIYGSLGAGVGFMTWIWLSTTVMLVGAQLNAEMELQTALDSTDGTEKRQGNRDAFKADHVA